MQKSMYSLMLMDSVVKAIDEMASSMNTNRSNLVNQVLADYVSLTTPEKKMREIFSLISDLISTSGVFEVQEVPSDSMLQIKSALAYKYRPTIRYSVELYRMPEQAFGELKISFRTQSSELLMELAHFFSLWTELEEIYVHRYFPRGSIRYSVEPGRFTRTFVLPCDKGNCENDALSRAVADYIRMIDEILKGYLSGEYDGAKAIEKRYVTYLKNGMTMI